MPTRRHFDAKMLLRHSSHPEGMPVRENCIELLTNFSSLRYVEVVIKYVTVTQYLIYRQSSVSMGFTLPLKVPSLRHSRLYPTGQ